MSEATGGFDLTRAKEVTAKEEEGQVVQMEDELGRPMFYENGAGERPVTVTVVGSYSARYRRALEAQQERTLKRRRTTPEDLRKESTDLLAACVLAWDGFFDNGVPLPCERRNVVTVLDGFGWVREKVDREIHDHAGFFKKNSST